MDKASIILMTLIGYKLVLVGFGLWAQKRTQSSADFFIGGKRLGPWVAAISASASASSAWSLLGMSSAAYLMGLSAIWLFPSVILGYIFNWLWLAPRLRRAANKQRAITLTEFVAGHGRGSFAIKLMASVTIIFSFSFYIAAQFQGAGTSFASSFGINGDSAIILGAIIILLYTLLGGFWAVSLTDTLQGLLMAVVAFMLPFAALASVGVNELYWHIVYDSGGLAGSHSGIYAVAFVIGLFGIGWGNLGQPHVLNRFMAIKDKKSMSQAKLIGILWPTIVFGGMLILGWCGRLLLPGIEDSEKLLFQITELLFHPVVAGIIIAAVLSAVMSTADSQLLVAAASFAHDLGMLKGHNSLLFSRLTLVVMCLISGLIALYAPQDIFSRVLFAWNALGSAFGPLILVLLLGYQVSYRARFSAISCGFGLTVVFSLMDNTPGDWLERIIPFLCALLIVIAGSNKLK
ncbi:sodium/proline symporter [Paraferrimonas sp. SM1919]|uniref:sodium/proline symporter n=1 Tax=Paraferrimonas sp. SM1919 TaxID=2662263 RepID=UPI0013D37E56|nr:sodium/proline symporter [Paraferrimonas sp. SM1919]